MLFERLWTLAAPNAEPLPPRASGMIRLLRELPFAELMLRHAEHGDCSPLLDFLRPHSLFGWSPPLLHHLALFHRDCVEHALSTRPDMNVERECSLVIACWLALGNEGAYLRSLAEDVFGDQGPQAHRAAHEAAFFGIRAVTEFARVGLDGHTPAPASALRALTHIHDAIAIAGASAELSERARSAANAARSELVHDLLAPLAREASSLAAREWMVSEVHTWLARATAAWRWADEEVEIERFIVAELPRFAWELYRDKRWDDLRRILGPIASPTDRLAGRIERESRHLAWSAPCAQALVFRAELAPTLAMQMELAERAYRMAPNLRNARLVLADLLCARAERRLIPKPFLTRQAWQSARDDLERATQLFPELSRLPVLRERLSSGGFE